MMIELILPWPPTVNHIWKRGKGRTYLTKKGVEWYAKAVEQIHSQHQPTSATERISVHVDLYPPNRVRWDLDNRTKCVLDALVRASVIADDEQVDELYLKRHGPDPEKQGYAVVKMGIIGNVRP